MRWHSSSIWERERQIRIASTKKLRATQPLKLREAHRLKVLRIFGPRRDEVAGGWRRLQNEEIQTLYTSPNIFGVIKSTRMRWWGSRSITGGRDEKYTKFWSGNLKREDHSVDLGVDWENNTRMDLKQMVGGTLWTRCNWLRGGTSGGLMWTR
jgi:hypothetical protein